MHINFSPRFLAEAWKSPQVAHIIHRRSTPRKASLQVFFKLRKTFSSSIRDCPFAKVYSPRTTQYNNDIIPWRCNDF
jgi:hypothetical protein